MHFYVDKTLTNITNRHLFVYYFYLYLTDITQNKSEEIKIQNLLLKILNTRIT